MDVSKVNGAAAQQYPTSGNGAVTGYENSAAAGCGNDAAAGIGNDTTSENVTFQSVTEKNSLQLLHEWAMRKGFLVKYDLEATNGVGHLSTYTMKVTVDDITAVGQCRSKKAAKHEAAKAALAIITEKGIGLTESKSTKPKTKKRKIEKMTQEVDDPNLIKLREMCAANGWPVPTYITQFTSRCKIGNYEADGFGPNKTVAKKEAAAAMINMLNNLPSEGSWRSGV